jgi:hypothetical protein
MMEHLRQPFGQPCGLSSEYRSCQITVNCCKLLKVNGSQQLIRTYGDSVNSSSPLVTANLSPASWTIATRSSQTSRSAPNHRGRLIGDGYFNQKIIWLLFPPAGVAPPF